MYQRCQLISAFYTKLGHPTFLNNSIFLSILLSFINWILEWVKNNYWSLSEKDRPEIIVSFMALKIKPEICWGKTINK